VSSTHFNSYPCGHAQSVMAVLAADELALSAHAVHVAEPAFVLYVPVGQEAHVDPFVPENPGLQTHAVIAVLASGEVALTGHHTQLVDPVFVEYVPAVQAVHVAGPTEALYLPTPQSTQAVAPASSAYVPALQFTQAVAFSRWE